jgi:excisionase family DNA binding protein
MRLGMKDMNARALEARRGSPFLNTDQAAYYIGLAKQTLEKMRRERRGPFYRKHGRFVRYHIADLDAWSEASGIAAAHARSKTNSSDVGTR